MVLPPSHMSYSEFEDLANNDSLTRSPRGEVPRTLRCLTDKDASNRFRRNDTRDLGWIMVKLMESDTSTIYPGSLTLPQPEK